MTDFRLAVVRDNGRRIVAIAEFARRRTARKRAQAMEAGRDHEAVPGATWTCGDDGRLTLAWRIQACASATVSLPEEAAG